MVIDLHLLQYVPGEDIREGTVIPVKIVYKILLRKKKVCTSGIREKYFSRGAKSLFLIFSWRCEMLFPGRISILVDLKQISVVSKKWKRSSVRFHTFLFYFIFFIPFHFQFDSFPLRGYCTSYQNLACFVLYLKIVNTFLKNNICIL